MATVKLSEKPTVTAMAANDTVVMVDASGNVVRINRASLAEAVRSVMATATSSANGLMSKGWFSDISPRIPLSAGFSGDLDKIHELYGSGLFFVSVTGGDNRPVTNTYGTLISAARSSDTVVTASMQIMQIYAANGSLYVRSGGGNGSAVVFTAWAKLT